MLRPLFFHSIDDLKTIQGEGSFFSEYHKLKDFEFGQKKEIENITNKNLKKLITYSYSNIPFYRSLWEKDAVSPNLFGDINDLSKFPIVTKDMVRSNFPSQIVNNKLKSRVYYDSTAGSTGKPLEFYVDKKSNPYRTASYMIFNTWMGVKPFDLHWNPKIILPRSWSQSLWLWLIQKNLYSIMDFDKEHLKEIVGIIDTLKPMYIESYTASIAKLAYLLDEYGLELSHKPKAILATSETLLDSQRELMQRIFGCKVFNRYGSREFSGAIAQECPEFDGMHINPFLTHIEIVDENNEEVGEGESGRILVTDLNNYVMPFIRYEIGDIGVKSPQNNPCGRAFPTLSNITGRAGVYLIDKEGEKIPLEGIVTVIIMWTNVPYIYQYQFIQVKKGEVKLKIVPDKKFTEEIAKNITDGFHSMLKDFELELELVDEIKPSRTGKTPFLISTLEGGIPA